MGSSEKKDIGTYFELPEEYHLYFVNNGKNEIEIDISGRDEKTNFMKLPPKSMHLFNKYLWWWFEWSYRCSFDARIGETYEFTIRFEVPKGGPDDDILMDIPVLNKKAHNLPFEIELKKSA